MANSGVSRLRPVAMAVTIIFAFMLATMPMMIVVTVLYAMFFRAPSPSLSSA